MIEDPDNEVFVSHLSFMEIAIKQMVNRLPEFAVTLDELVEKVEAGGFTILFVLLPHIRSYSQVPLYADRRDPFDRLILATALVEQMPVISADEKFSRYRDLVEVIW